MVKTQSNSLTNAPIYTGLKGIDNNTCQYIKPSRWLAEVKSLVRSFCTNLTDAELLNDMYSCGWTPRDVYSYLQDHYKGEINGRD